MALSRRAAKAFIKLGFVQFLFGCAGVGCGALARNKFVGQAGASIGFWAAYFIVWGIICIAAGSFKASRILGAVLIAHVIGLIIALIAIVISALFWVFLNTCSSSPVVAVRPVLSDFCACGAVGDISNHEVSCSNLKMVRNVAAASTIIYLVLEMTSLVGLIYSFHGLCASKEPREETVTTVNPPKTSKTSSETNDYDKDIQ